MCLRRANPLRGAFEGLGPKSQDFLWALKSHEQRSGLYNTTSINSYYIITFPFFSCCNSFSFLPWLPLHPAKFLPRHVGPLASAPSYHTFACHVWPLAATSSCHTPSMPCGAPGCPALLLYFCYPPVGPLAAIMSCHSPMWDPCLPFPPGCHLTL